MSALRYATVVLVVLLATSASAQVPDYISFQGKLFDPVSGEAVTDTMITMGTKLYQDNGVVYLQVHEDVVVNDGVFNLQIGPLAGVTFDQPTELGLTINPVDGELTPRTPLLSVPYAHSLKLPFVGSGTASVNDGLIQLKVHGGGAGVQVDSSAGPGMTVEYAAAAGLEVLESGQDGFTVADAGDDGLNVTNAGGNGVRVNNAGTDGVYIDDAGDDGIDIRSAGDNGVFIGLVGSPSVGNFSAGHDGIEIVGAQNHGVFVGGAGADGLRVEQSHNGVDIRKADNFGLVVDSAAAFGLFLGYSGAKGIYMNKVGSPSQYVNPAVGSHGIAIGSVEGDGLRLSYADGSGLYVNHANEYGVRIDQADGTGVRVFQADFYGFHVSHADLAGVYVEDTGGNGVSVGHADGRGVLVSSADSYAAEFRRALNGSSVIANHAVLIHNNASGTNNGPDVLALKMTNISPGANANYVTFFNGNDDAVGAIEGNLSGGVVYKSGGADYAEYLPRANPDESFDPGDVVGVFKGSISHRTSNAEEVMVITDRAGVLGNSPGEDEAVEGFETVSFMGQVRVRVVGAVEAGDYLIASGSSDGTAVAVHERDISLSDLRSMVGKAWESSPDVGVQRVSAVVGIDRSEVLTSIIERQQAEIDELRELITATRSSS